MEIKKAKLSDLKPTQITVGEKEVKEKKKELGHMNKKELDEFLKMNPIPVVLGPEQKSYILDHHHLGKSLVELGHKECYTVVLHDFSTLEFGKFLQVMQLLELIHLYDENNVQDHLYNLPKHVSELKDDPFRSLAGYVRKHKGYIKTSDAKPYVEFKWAEFFRLHITPDELKEDFDASLFKALTLAVREDAKELPGWIGQI
jgi:hypothetical protein